MLITIQHACYLKKKHILEHSSQKGRGTGKFPFLINIQFGTNWLGGGLQRFMPKYFIWFLCIFSPFILKVSVTKTIKFTVFRDGTKYYEDWSYKLHILKTSLSKKNTHPQVALISYQPSLISHLDSRNLQKKLEFSYVKVCFSIKQI